MTQCGSERFRNAYTCRISARIDDGIAENVGKKAPWILQSRVVSESGMGMAASVYESRVVSESGMGVAGEKSDSIERIITLKNNEHKQTER